MYARGKACRLSKHAHDGLAFERPPITNVDVRTVLEEPDSDDGRAARRRIGRRTVLVYYSEYEDEIFVRGVSATRSYLEA